jgi:hypothetical protein
MKQNEGDRSDHVFQNPQNLAPANIIAAQCLLEVSHYGFDDRVHEGSIVIHHEVKDDVAEFFARAFALRFPIEKVIPIGDARYGWDDERSMADNNTSGFNYRTIMGTDKLSNHATGRAFDVNPKQNIYAKYDTDGSEVFCYPLGARYDEGVKGTLTSDHPLVLLMKERGWVWGGDWFERDGVVDYQHFEKPE